MTIFVVLPGIGGSGPSHWQTLWQSADRSMRRFSPSSWDLPSLEDWLASLDTVVAACGSPPVLVAHSLACLLVAHWQARSGLQAKGAFLVAVPDTASASFPVEALSFADPPAAPFRFPALMLASTDDPYAAPAFTRRCAEHWGCDLELLGALGHINGSSGLGDWPEGRARLDRFAASLH
jgi:predicted alpha/beta hydrolase family esterase